MSADDPISKSDLEKRILSLEERIESLENSHKRIEQIELAVSVITEKIGKINQWVTSFLHSIM